MKTTTLIIFLFVFASFVFCSDKNFQNEVIFDKNEPENFLTSLSSRQRRHVKKELLNLLGLDHIPRSITSRIKDDGVLSAPKYMLSLYRSLQEKDDYDEDDFTTFKTNDDVRFNVMSTRFAIGQQLGSADTVTSFINQAHAHGSRNSLSIECLFDLSQVSSTDVLTGAVLRIYKSSKLPIEKLRLEVHRMQRNDSTNRESRTLQQRVLILSNKNGWIDVDVTPLASEWMRYPKKNEGLQVIVHNYKGEKVNPASVGIVGDGGPSDKQIFLVAFFKSNHGSLPEQLLTSNIIRRKRSTPNENKRNGKKQRQQHESGLMNDDHQAYRNTHSSAYKHDRKCQLRNLKVSFKDLKWQDWIIAPEGYGAHYCDGDCVSPLHAHNATNHAIVQTMAYLINPTAVPKPCCAPTKLAGLSVLYFDDNSNVILKKYRNMVVKSCGCH